VLKFDKGHVKFCMVKSLEILKGGVKNLKALTSQNLYPWIVLKIQKSCREGLVDAYSERWRSKCYGNVKIS